MCVNSADGQATHIFLETADLVYPDRATESNCGLAKSIDVRKAIPELAMA